MRDRGRAGGSEAGDCGRLREVGGEERSFDYGCDEGRERIPGSPVTRTPLAEAWLLSA